MPEDVGGEKTLPASPQKRQKAREEGNIAKSQDLSAAWTMLVALLAMLLLGRDIFDLLLAATRHYIGDAASLYVEPDTSRTFAIDVVVRLGAASLPIMGILAAAGIAANFVQVGFLYAPKQLIPRLEKLNPFTGLGKFFNIRTAAEFVKSILKLFIVTYVAYLVLRDRWPELLALPYLTPLGIVASVGSIVFAVWLRIVIAMIVLGVLDYGFQRWRYETDLRMTTQEAKEEMKQAEGDPRIRQRIRSVQRQLAMQRMMREVPTAEVIVTNPTMYAVAIRYDMAKMDAPVVVAKGMRLIAQRIREIAVEHDVPIVERPELARGLYHALEVGDMVPERFFRAVAEVLAFVYRIDQRVEKKREREATMAAERQRAGKAQPGKAQSGKMRAVETVGMTRPVHPGLPGGHFTSGRRQTEALGI